MAEHLVQSLHFVNVPNGGTASLPHGLNVADVAKVPDIIAFNTDIDFDATADATNVTVTNHGGAPETVDVLAIYLHSVQRAFGAVGVDSEPPTPFVIKGASGAGSPSGGVFIAGAGAGSAIQNNASGNAATGVDSTVAGENNQISGAGSFAEGNGNVETITTTGAGNGGSNHLEGNGNTITVALADGGGFNHLEGNSNSVTGVGGNACDFNHVEGNDNALHATGGPVEFNHVEGNRSTLTMTAGGETSFNHVEGNNHSLTGNGDDCDTNHVEGDSNAILNGSVCHLEGINNSATASTVHVEGDGAKASRETQYARASGRFAAAGDAQRGGIELRGSTPGSAPNESVELKFGDSRDQEFLLDNGKAYAIKIRAVASITGGTQAAAFEGTAFLAVQDGGVISVNPGAPITITQTGHIGAGAASWTVTVTIGAGPARIVVTVATGGGVTAAVRAVATIDWTEVGHA